MYCISVLTGLLHHPHDGFLDWELYAVYTVSFLVVLQVWMHATVLINRYGTKSRGDYARLLINMFLLYFIATGISEEWSSTAFTFDIAWACILVNLIVHWGLKLVRFEGLDDDDRAIIKRSMAVLFLIYDYEYDNLLDHHSETDGMGYLALNAWIVLVLGNLTVALDAGYTFENREGRRAIRDAARDYASRRREGSEER